MRGDISTALMVLFSIRNELKYDQLIETGLQRYDDHQMAIGTLLAWIHNEGIRNRDCYFAARVAQTDPIKDNIPEITMLINESISQLQRANDILVME